MTDNDLRRMHIRSAQHKIERAWLALKEEADVNPDAYASDITREIATHLRMAWRVLDVKYGKTLGMNHQEALENARDLTDEV